MLTIDQVKAVEDIAEYSRSILTVEAAERIAKAFGFTLEQLNIEPHDYGPYQFEKGTKGVATETLSCQLAKQMVPGFKPEPCSYGGSGKSADHYTFEGLRAIKEAISYPHLYVREKRGPDRHPECEGHPAGPYDPMGETAYCDGSCQSNWTILGSGEILGYELLRVDPEDWNSRDVLETFTTENEAYEALVDTANHRRVQMTATYRKDGATEVTALVNDVEFEIIDGAGVHVDRIAPLDANGRPTIGKPWKQEIPVYVWAWVGDSSYTAPPHVARALEAAWEKFWEAEKCR